MPPTTVIGWLYTRQRHYGTSSFKSSLPMRGREDTTLLLSRLVALNVVQASLRHGDWPNVVHFVKVSTSGRT